MRLVDHLHRALHLGEIVIEPSLHQLELLHQLAIGAQLPEQRPHLDHVALLLLEAVELLGERLAQRRRLALEPAERCRERVDALAELGVLLEQRVGGAREIVDPRREIRLLEATRGNLQREKDRRARREQRRDREQHAERARAPARRDRRSSRRGSAFRRRDALGAVRSSRARR